jgi:ADP-ribosylglycohydrolase
MTDITCKDRIKGSIMGALIGDALGVGPHWYYDLDELKATYGPWIDDYVAEKPGRYHEGLQPGDVSQTGQITVLLLESVAECGGYNEDDYTRRLDDLFATLDGTPFSGGYTDSAMRYVWKARHLGIDWSEAGSFQDTSEAAIRTPVLAGRYAKNLELAKEKLVANIKLTHRDVINAGDSTAFGLTVCALINGVPLGKVTSVLMGVGRLPGPRPTADEAPRPRSRHIPPEWENASIELTVYGTPVATPAGSEVPTLTPFTKFIDAVIQNRHIYEAAHNPAITIEPASEVCGLYGRYCIIGGVVPAATYLAARFEDDFEMAVLSAINGGGNNMARAALTGGLSGAQVGLSGIPERFITGLTDHERLLELCERVADAAEKDVLRDSGSKGASRGRESHALG